MKKVKYAVSGLILAVFAGVLVVPSLVSASHTSSYSNGGYYETYYVNDKVTYYEPVTKKVCNTYDYDFRWAPAYPVKTCYYTTVYEKRTKYERVAKQRWVPYPVYPVYPVNPVYSGSTGYGAGYGTGYYDGSMNYPYGYNYGSGYGYYGSGSNYVPTTYTPYGGGSYYMPYYSY